MYFDVFTVSAKTNVALIETNYGIWVKSLIDKIKTHGWDGIRNNEMKSVKNNFSILELKANFADNDGSGYRFRSVSATSTIYNLNNYKKSVRFFDIDGPSGVFPPFYQATNFRINTAFANSMIQKLKNSYDSNYKSKILLDNLWSEFKRD